MVYAKVENNGHRDGRCSAEGPVGSPVTKRLIDPWIKKGFK